MKSKEPKKRPDKLSLAFNIAAAVTAVGLFLLYLLVSPEQLEGSTFLHGLQIAFVILAVICAFGLAYVALKKMKKRKQ